MYKKIKPYTSKNRPERPNQIFGYPGNDVKFIVFYDGVRSYPAKTLMCIKDKKMLIEADLLDKPIIVSMADFGMVPYFSGLWNIVNWAERIEE